MGIEPTALAWEARVLPLYDARAVRHFMRGCWGWASDSNADGESEVAYTPFPRWSPEVGGNNDVRCADEINGQHVIAPEPVR